MLLKEEEQDMKNRVRKGKVMMESPMRCDGKPGEAMESP